MSNQFPSINLEYTQEEQRNSISFLKSSVDWNEEQRRNKETDWKNVRIYNS